MTWAGYLLRYMRANIYREKERGFQQIKLKKKMFFSFIVPAYNVEKYISKCIDSLLKQDIVDYEIIVVNDGSTDATDKIIREKYADKVIYVDKGYNSGLSDTRNYGLEIARGKYILFIDSDDYIEQNILGQLKDEINKFGTIDVVYVGHIVDSKNGMQRKLNYSCINKKMSSAEFLKCELSERRLPIPACFAIYRKEFLDTSKIQFETGILHEDELWSPTVMLKSESIVALDICFYHYVQREGSITKRKDLTQNGLDVMYISSRLLVMSNDIKDTRLRLLFNNHTAMLYMKGMCRGRLYRAEYREKFSRFLPIKYAYFLKDRIKAVIFAISPYVYYKLDKKYGTKL